MKYLEDNEDKKVKRNNIHRKGIQLAFHLVDLINHLLIVNMKKE